MSLLAAIEREPDCELHYGALADYYMENGELLRAELVRVEWELYGLRGVECWTEYFEWGTQCTDPDCPWLRMDKLRDRRWELIQEIERARTVS